MVYLYALKPGNASHNSEHIGDIIFFNNETYSKIPLGYHGIFDFRNESIDRFIDILLFW